MENFSYIEVLEDFDFLINHDIYNKKSTLKKGSILFLSDGRVFSLGFQWKLEKHGTMRGSDSFQQMLDEGLQMKKLDDSFLDPFLSEVDLPDDHPMLKWYAGINKKFALENPKA